MAHTATRSPPSAARSGRSPLDQVAGFESACLGLVPGTEAGCAPCTGASRMIARVRAPRTRVHAYMYMQWLHALCLSIRGMYVGAAASLHSFCSGCIYVALA